MTNRSGGEAKEPLKGAEADAQIVEKQILLVESIVRPADLITQALLSRPTPTGPAKHQMGIVGAEQQALMRFRMAPQLQQHAEAVGQGQRRDVRIEMRIAPHQIQERLDVAFVNDQAGAAPVGGNDRRAFVQGGPQSVRITGGLVPAGQGELLADVAEQGQFQLRELPVKRNIPPVPGIEPLRIRQHLHKHGAGCGTAFQFLNSVPSLRIDGDTR